VNVRVGREVWEGEEAHVFFRIESNYVEGSEVSVRDVR
jgi:hypothetical protein